MTRPKAEQLTERFEQTILGELEARARRRRPCAPPYWLPAIEIARMCEIRPGGSNDSRKRGVREVMHQLMRKHAHIISSHLPRGGYAIATEQSDLRNYQESRRRSGLSQLQVASLSKRSIAQDDADGQLSLLPKGKPAGPTNPMAAGV